MITFDAPHDFDYNLKNLQDKLGDKLSNTIS